MAATGLVLIDDPGRFSPWPEQQPFLDDFTCRYCAMAGGWGAGKSRMGSRKLANLHLYNALDEHDQPTGVPSLIVAPTYQLAYSVNIPQMRDALDDMGLSHRFVADQKKCWFELPDLGTARNPSLIYVRSADAAKLIAGFEVGAVWGDEAARWPWAREGEDPLDDAFLQSDARLRHPSGRFYQFNLTYTNEGEDTRVYQDFEAEPKPGHRLYRVSTRANKSLAPEYVQSQMDQLSVDLASQYIDGYAAKLGANLLYGNYDPVYNDDKALALIDGLPVQMAVDFNKNPGMHAEIGQHLRDGGAEGDELLTTVAEIHRPAMLIKQMVLEFHMRFGAGFEAGRWPIVELFGDVSGRTGSMKDGESYWDVIRTELDGYGIPSRLKLPSHAPGIADRVNAANCAFRSATGKVRWKINPAQCPRLVRDFRNLKWQGNEIDKRDKKLSHASDADTYRVHYLLPVRPFKRVKGYVGSAA